MIVRLGRTHHQWVTGVPIDPHIVGEHVRQQMLGIARDDGRIADPCNSAESISVGLGKTSCAEAAHRKILAEGPYLMDVISDGNGARG